MAELPKLTVEERAALDRLAKGFTYKEIMAQFQMSHTTFYLTLRVARAKLGAETTIQAVAVAVKRRLIDLDV